MEVHFTPELEAKLTESAAQQGRHTDELVQEALVQYLADQLGFPSSMESWTDEDLQEAIAHIEEGLVQCEAGELISASEARADISRMKDGWRKNRSPAR